MEVIYSFHHLTPSEVFIYSNRQQLKIGYHIGVLNILRSLTYGIGKAMEIFLNYTFGRLQIYVLFLSSSQPNPPTPV